MCVFYQCMAARHVRTENQPQPFDPWKQCDDPNRTQFHWVLRGGYFRDQYFTKFTSLQVTVITACFFHNRCCTLTQLIGKRIKRQDKTRKDGRKRGTIKIPTKCQLSIVKGNFFFPNFQ